MRDPETWYESVQEVIVKLYRWVLKPFFWTTELGRQYTAIIGCSLDYMFHGDLSKENCIAAFLAHNAEMKARVPPERLLIWRPQDGWEPLARCSQLQIYTLERPCLLCLTCDVQHIHDTSAYSLQRNHKVVREVCGVQVS